MTSQIYRRLENALAAAEETLSREALLGTRAREIWEELNRLIQKVVCERIRLEEIEGQALLIRCTHPRQPGARGRSG